MPHISVQEDRKATHEQPERDPLRSISLRSTSKLTDDNGTAPSYMLLKCSTMQFRTWIQAAPRGYNVRSIQSQGNLKNPCLKYIVLRTCHPSSLFCNTLEQVTHSSHSFPDPSIPTPVTLFTKPKQRQDAIQIHPPLPLPGLGRYCRSRPTRQLDRSRSHRRQLCQGQRQRRWRERQR